MEIFVIIIAVLGYALFYLPVYLPFLLSFLFRGSDRRALRVALRIAPVCAVFILAARTRPSRPDFGDDVAGSFRGAEYYSTHEFWPDVAWTWGAGLFCFFAALALGLLLCRRRQRVTDEHVTHNAA